MTATKKLKVYQKYGGRCAYCGQRIELKEMQVDHIKPKADGGTDELENLNPACALCNHYKRATPLELWRDEFIGRILDRLQKTYIFRVAERYGMVKVRSWNRKFYFEEFQEERNDTKRNIED